MNDLIKREDVVALWDKYHYEIATKAVEFDKALREIPSAEPKKGKWKRYYIDRGEFGERPSIFYCSACHACSIVKTDFCPNCGADMRGESDD